MDVSAHMLCIWMLPGLEACLSLCRLDLLPLCMGTFNWKDKFMKQVWGPESFLVMTRLYIALFMGCLCHCSYLPCCGCHPMDAVLKPTPDMACLRAAVWQTGVLDVKGSCAECQEAAWL